MKKSNITHLTACNVQPNSTPQGDIDLPFYNVHAFYLPNLTDAQRAKIPASELREGAMFLDVTDPDNHLVKVYCTKHPDPNPAWHIAQTTFWIDAITSENKSTPVTKLTGLDVQPDFNNKNDTFNIFYMPHLETVEMFSIPDDELRHGAMIYNHNAIGEIVVYMNNGGNENSWFHLTGVV